MVDQTAALQVGVFIYNDAEELDFVGPYEAFRAGGLIAKDNGLSGCEVFTVAANTEPISTNGGDQGRRWDENSNR